MKTIGILAGMSWESTQCYYQIMNRTVQQILGGYNSIEAIIYSVNLARLDQNDWSSINKELIEIAQKLEAAAADFLIITSNTAHKAFNAIEEAVKIPLIHIADPTIFDIQKSGLKKIAPLGTKVTMEEKFYIDRLTCQGLEIIVPPSKERETIHKIIFSELIKGKISEESKETAQRILEELKKDGAEGIILGCTELNLLIDSSDLPLFDTTTLHAEAAVNYSLDLSENDRS